MHLHRTIGKPDWEAIPAENRNYWQRLAASTQGVITLPNIFTVIGFVLVVWGAVLFCLQHYWLGLGLIVIGRLCDILDGWTAEATGTKSPLGEFLDVTADKLGTLVTVIACFVAHVTAWWLLALLLLPHLITTVITTQAYFARTPLHPSRIGKLSMAAAWVCLDAFLLIKAADAAHTYSVIAGIIALATVALGLYSAFGYARERAAAK